MVSDQTANQSSLHWQYNLHLWLIGSCILKKLKLIKTMLYKNNVTLS
jgi:hypothetical protein